MLNSRLQVPRHLASKLHTYPSVASFVAFFACGTKFTYCERSLVPWLISSVRARERAWVYTRLLRATNAAEARLRVRLFSSTTQLPPCAPSEWLDEARTKRRSRSIRYPVAANFTSGVDAYTGVSSMQPSTLNFWACLSCERPWALSRDSIL